MIEIEDVLSEESVDFLCQLCNTPLVLGARQEYGQPLTTAQPLVIYGECPSCGEVYTTIFEADIEATLDMQENGYVT